MKIFSRQIYLHGFRISKLNNLKVIHDLYSQYLTQALSKTTYFLVRKEYLIVPVLQAAHVRMHGSMFKLQLGKDYKFLKQNQNQYINILNSYKTKPH